MTPLEGKVALITGSGAGLGRAYALELASRGAGVIVHDIDPDGAAETARLLSARGSEARRVLINDITNVVEFERLAVEAEEAVGHIDILVNNAGIDIGRKFEDITEADFDHMFAVHVKGTFFATKSVVPSMKRQRSGKIINISSINGMIADDQDSHYSGAKAAILGLTKAWAKEFAPYRICVNAVAPGHVLTEGGTIIRGWERIQRISEERILLKRYAAPEEIAPTVAFLASPESDFITGQVISPNGGEAIVGI